jgi:HK97 family phage portal protein
MGLLSKKRPSSADSPSVASLPIKALPPRRDVQNSTLANPDEDFLRALWQGAESSSGVKVTPLKAMGVSTVFACVRILCRTIATMPVDVFVKDETGALVAAEDKATLRRLLTLKPNEEMTAYNFKTSVQYHLGLRNLSYAQIQRNRLGEPIGLIPLHRDDVVMMRTQPKAKNLSGELRYKVKGETLGPSEILRIVDFTRDGISGVDVATAANDVLGLAIALDQSASKSFANGSRLGGVLHTDNKLDPTRRDSLKAQMENQYSGVGNVGKTLVLEQGLKWMQTQSTNRDAEFNESRKSQAYEICRLFGVQPHQVGILQDATLNNVESMSIEYLKYGVMPMVSMWEQSLACALLTDEEIEAGYCIRFDFSDLLRADIKSLADYFSKGRQWGWLTADEVREAMNKNPLPDGEGKGVLSPLNMIDSNNPPPSE